MRRPSRFRRVAKYTGTALCLMLAAIWLESAWRYVVWAWQDRDGTTAIWLQYGMIEIYSDDLPSFGGPETWPGRVRSEGFAQRGMPNLHWEFGFGVRAVGNSITRYRIPLWLPFLVLAAPTMWLWHHDRRTPAGHCGKCHYDLTGITSKVCPECGSPIKSPH